MPCAVVEGPNGIQRVLSETGLANAILGGRSGASKRLKKAAEEGGAPVPLFVAPRQLKPFISQDLIEGPESVSQLVIGQTNWVSCRSRYTSATSLDGQTKT